MVMMSGTTFQWSTANQAPVRPRPAMTSSQISRMPYVSQSARSPCM
jgi:hypothetical protein